MVRQAISRALTVLLVIVLLSLALGQVLGQPVLIAYVDSESMEPAINEGDGFVALPNAVTGSPQTGDVVTFHAEELQGGGLITHRIVDETADGYITRGDNNPFTDQDGDEPPVTDEQVVATALQVGDTVVTIPHFGTVVEGTHAALHTATSSVGSALGVHTGDSTTSVGLGIFLLGFTLFVASFVADYLRPQGRDLARSERPSGGLDPRKLAVIVLLVVLIPANATMLAGSGTTDLVLDGGEVADVEAVSPGDPIEAEFEATNTGLMTLLIVLEPTPADDDVTIDRPAFGLPTGETVAATATAPAPPPDVERTVTVSEHRYPLVLPEGVLLFAHGLHPFVAIGAVNLFIVVSVVGFIGGLFGFDTVRFRDTSRDVPLRLVVKRWIRQ